MRAVAGFVGIATAVVVASTWTASATTGPATSSFSARSRAVVDDPGTVTTPTPVAVPALTALKALPIKGRAAMTGYTRARFGQAWSDVDRNGCDTRNDVLRRDLRPVVVATNGCVAVSGTLTDPYTGAVVRYTGGGAVVQIDHVVALADAWVKGAQQWTQARRTAFANDPLNLLATTTAANDRKKAGDAATWLPPRTAIRCTYVARQIAVKRSYGLWVTRAESAVMARILAACPQQVLPTAAGARTPSVTRGPVASPTRSSSTSTAPTRTAPKTTSPTRTSPTRALNPRFPTCRAAKAAGYGPYYRGRDPEYAWYVDADGDGIVCE